MHSNNRFILCLLLLLCSVVSTAASAWSWEDLWLTPHQKASRALQNENFKALTDNEDRDWQGVGHYQLGDHAAAAERFADGESVGSQYNHATTLTQAGEYDKAIELFDEVLKQQPNHEKAEKNRDIARQLKELQQQQQQQDSQDGESEQNNDDQQQSEQSQENSSDNQDSQSQDEQDSQSQSEAEDEQQSEEEKEQQENMEEQDGDSEDATQQPLAEAEVPLSEDQQATEQWLRKIPDDPAGLLRRKLRRNHAAEYPNVVNGESPW